MTFRGATDTGEVRSGVKEGAEVIIISSASTAAVAAATTAAHDEISTPLGGHLASLYWAMKP